MAGAVNIRLGAIVTDFVAGFRAAGAAAGQLITTLNGNLSAGFAAADRQSRQFERGIGQLGRTIQSFGRQASIVTASIALIGVTSFKSYSEINALQLGLENITGSAAAATARFNELLPVVRLPGLGLEEAIKGDVRLQAVGFSAQQSKDALLQFGNALALTGGGKFELDSVLTQLTQMGSKAKVLSEDLKPILTSSPAVAKAIKQMFGTVDSEQISAKLEAAGRSPMDFITDLTAKLSQLERVKGGPKNALENLGDSLKLAEFNFGQAADKAFGLTDIINRVGDGATGLADKFGALSPVTQKVILTVTGLVAAIGPLAIGVGGLLALVPSITAGAAAITTTLGVAIGPILLIGAAIVGVAILVATNWSSIKTILTDSGIWQTLTGLVSSAFRFIQSAFSAFVNLGQVLWARFGGFFTGIAKTAFEVVVALFKFNAGLLQGIFGFLSGVLTLDWREALNGLLNIAKSFWNLLIDGFKLVAAGVGRAISATFQLFGGTSIADRITAGIDKALVKVDGLKGSIQSVQTVAKAGVALNVATGAKNAAKAPVVKPFDYSTIDLGGSAYQKAKDRLKALKDEIASGNLKGLDVSAQQAEYDKLKASLDSATSSFKAQKTAVEGAGSALTTNERILKRLTKELKEQGDTADQSRSRQVAAFQDLVKLDKERATFKPVNIGEVKPLSSSTVSNARVNSIVSSGGVTAAGANGSLASIGLPGLAEFQRKNDEQIRDAQLSLVENKRQLRFALADFPNVFGSIKDEMQRVAESDPLNARGLVTSVLASSQAISGAISSTKAGLISGGIDLLANIGEGLASGKASFKSIIKSVIDMIADAVIAIGKVMITTGIPLSLFPATAALGFKQILTGGAIVLAGGLAKGLASSLLSDNVKNFAGGGLFKTTSLIRVGESSRATSGGLGEWVSPVGLGANLIGDRIMKRLAGDSQFNRPDMSRFSGGQKVQVQVVGSSTLRNGDIHTSYHDYEDQNSYFN